MRARDRNQVSTAWVWISLLPLGLGAWAPAVAGDRCGVRRWTALGLLWPAVSLSGWIWAGVSSGTSKPALAGWLMLAGWIGGFVTSLKIRSAYRSRLAGGGIERERPPWPEPTKRSRSWTVRYAIVAFIVTFGGDLLLGLLLERAFSLHVSVGVGVLIVDATLLLALIPLARARGLSLPDLGVRRTLPLRSLGLATLTLLAYGTLAGVYTLVFIGHSTQHSADVLSQARHLGTAGTVVAVIAIAISAPVAEEIFFRGLLYRSLRNRLPTLWAALVAGSLFGLVHIIGYPLITVPIKAAFGVLACLLYERTRSVLPGIAVHSFVDATAIDLTLTGNDNIVLLAFGSLIAVLVIRWLVLSLVHATHRPLALDA